MTTDPQQDRARPADGHGRTVATEETFSWPPSATAVWFFVMALFCLGGPATWWAVTR